MNEASIPPLFSVIIPVFNKWDLTRACLASLREHTAGLDYEVIVMDNGSTDATGTELIPFGKSLFGDAFAALCFKENIHFGPACNAGAEAARSPLLFFLNNDTVLTPGWAPPLIHGLESDAAIGALGPLLLYENGTIQHMGAAFAPGGPCHLYKGFPADHPVVARPRKLQFITAAALMLRRDLFFQCGRFFEGYRNGFEDVELCVRIRQAGKKLTCVPASVIYHIESQSPGRNKDGTGHNDRLLYDRCGKDLYVDMHHHGMRDGFQVFVNDVFTLSLCLSDAEEEKLTALAKNKNIREWLEIMRCHPFWRTGREALADALEGEGQYTEALQLRAQLADFLPLESRYRQLLHTAEKAGDTTIMGMAETRLRTIRRYREDREHAAATVRQATSRAMNANDPFLSNLYTQKFTALHPSPHGLE